jgi:hypothetical protein
LSVRIGQGEAAMSPGSHPFIRAGIDRGVLDVLDSGVRAPNEPLARLRGNRVEMLRVLPGLLAVEVRDLLAPTLHAGHCMSGCPCALGARLLIVRGDRRRLDDDQTARAASGGSRQLTCGGHGTAGPRKGPPFSGMPQAAVGRTCRVPRAAPPRSSISPKAAPAPTRASPQSNVLGAATIALSLPARTAVGSPWSWGYARR